MKISKSLFKGMSRCRNFASLYDMYINTNIHHVTNIDGVDVTKAFQNISEGYFEDEKEKALEIFNHMFDEETGEDLTKVTSAQMEAFKDYFTKVEMLAGEHIGKHFDGNIIYDLDTKKQKKFTYHHNDHEYYCYLDIYLERPNGDICVFEVKSTTTNKFFKLGREIKDLKISTNKVLKSELYDSIFLKCNDGIIRLKEDIVADVSTDALPSKKYYDYREKLFDRFGSDGTGRYVFDLAIERFIIENSLKQQLESEQIPNIKYYLVVLNGDYIFDGTYIDGEPLYQKDQNGNDFIGIIDLTTVTMEWQDKIRSMAELIEENIDNRTIEKLCVGKYCEFKKTTECPFKGVCFSKVLIDGSILEYMNKHYAFKQDGNRYSVYELINKGCYTIDSIDREMLSKQNNLVQYDCYVNKKIYHNTEKILLACRNLSYPLYHLDFETYGAPLPRYKGEWPYAQSLFQFSLHIEKERGKCDKKLDHVEFLAPDHNDHRRTLCEEMIKAIDLSNGGTIIVYNESFEKSRLKEMAAFFPDLKNDLMKIHDAVFDLLYVLKGNRKIFYPLLSAVLSEQEREEKAKEINYYHSDMHGSFSIKRILPLFTSLSYNDLTVTNGTEAVLVYGLLPTYTEKEYEKYYVALREYCQQDTWAMVEILWGLFKLGN